MMYEKNAEISEAQEKEKYSIFILDNGIEKKHFRDNNTDVNALVQRLADGGLAYPEIGKNCEEISDLDFAELEQSKNDPPVFCAEINLSTTNIAGDKKPMDITVWDNVKIAEITLDEAIRSIRENGTVNLDYRDFAENDSNEELTEEYLTLSECLNNSYSDFMYRSSIYNDEHIAFVNEHGQLPYDVSTAENRNTAAEYINIQLESGSNLSESQKEILADLKNLILDIREMETKLGIDSNDCPSGADFFETVRSMSEWADKVQEKAEKEKDVQRDNSDFSR